MNLPPTYSLEGGAEGKRVLYENRPVYRPRPGGDQGPVEHERRRIAALTSKATVRHIERIAWLDYDVRNDGDPDQRGAALKLLARLFKGDYPVEAEPAA